MSEIPKMRTPEEIIDRIHVEQNTIEADLRENFLRNNFFHPYGPEKDIPKVAQLLVDFMSEKTGKNMGERFQMAISDKYFDKIHVVELGAAKAPFEKVGIDGLKNEYHDLLNWLVEHRYTDGEIPRSISDTVLEVRIPEDRAIACERIVIVRTRPLVNAVSPDGTIGVGIAKRMVFSIPTSLYKALAVQSGSAKLDTEEVLCTIEALIDQNNKQIDPIRTGYYLSAYKIEEQVKPSPKFF